MNKQENDLAEMKGEGGEEEEGQEENGVKNLRIDFLHSKMPQAYPCNLTYSFLFPLWIFLHSTVRDKILNSFRSGKTQFLITTDIVRRGIDIPNLNYVLNYDFPTNLVTYISFIWND